MPLLPESAVCDMTGATFTLPGSEAESDCTVLSPGPSGQPTGNSYICSPDALAVAPILQALMFPYSAHAASLVAVGVLTADQLTTAKAQIAALVATAKAAQAGAGTGP